MSKILAVDDDQDILFTLQAICQVADLEIVTLENGPQALRLLQEVEFDLVMVDYHMPKMNGLKLVKKIRELDSQIPILILTVDESLDLANKFINAGATDFATKPIRAADLISRMKLHLKLANLKQAEKMLDVESFDLPKGLTTTTMHIILNYLKRNPNPQTINTISANTGLAYQTVHRYVDYLFKSKIIGIVKNYGKIGRPINRYYYAEKNN